VPFPNFDPILVQLGPFAIRWYALAYVAGILLGWRYAAAMLKTPRLWGARGAPLTTDQLDDLVLWIAIGVIGGGRLGHVLFYTPLSDTLADPLSIVRVWEGGMSFHGGALGVTLALVIYAWRNKLDLLRIADLVAPAYPIGHFLGRCANFINGELWGREAPGLPWAVRFCNEQIVKTYGYCPAGPNPRHPSQLYEALFEGLVLFLILRWATHSAKLGERRGVVAGLFLLFYALFRIAIETVREPDAGMPAFPLGLTMGMILSLPMAAAGAFLVWRGLREPSPATAPQAG
jgi:phosphatidylglycerol:prolipoprotein diacylglycerol transferase